MSSNLIIPTIFFALSFPVLTDRIFLYLDFTHRISSIYSNIITPTENKQRTVKSPFSGVFCIDPLKILCLVRSLVLSKRLFRNHIESNILQYMATCIFSVQQTLPLWTATKVIPEPTSGTP